MGLLSRLSLHLVLVALLTLAPDTADAQNCTKFPSHPKCPTDPAPEPEPEPEPEPQPEPEPVSWIHPDVGVAHQSVTGLGSHLITVDNFGGLTYSGNLDGQQWLTHGEWTHLQSHLIAPGAVQTALSNQPSGADAAQSVAASFSGGLNVVNLSFGLMEYSGIEITDPDYTLGTVQWDSLVNEARAGTAVFVKAAGNTNGGTVDGTVTMRLPRPTLMYDALNVSLIGAPGALFVGALEGHGTVQNKASIASYSTIAGSTAGVADMFLVVGVEDSVTGLSGTSFGAPIVSGYAALLGQKFPTASPAQIVDQLLFTAREDTVAGYSPTIHGHGEACLFCALGPIAQPD